MATPRNIQTTLLGYDPYQRALEDRKLWANLYQSAQSPYERIGLGLAQLGGSLFGVGDSVQKPISDLNTVLAEVGKQFSPGTSEYYAAVAQALPDTLPDAKARAAQLARETRIAEQEVLQKQSEFVLKQPMAATPRLQELAAQIEANPNNQRAINEYNQIASSMMQGQQELNKRLAVNPNTAADQAVYEDLVKKFNGDTVAAGRAYNNYQANLRAVGNTPLTAGNVKPTDISGFISNVETQLKPVSTKLSKYNELKTLIKEINSGNTQAVPQLQRWLVTAAGDNQIGINEVRQIAQAGGFVERTVEGVQMFTTGLPSTPKLNKVLSVVNALETEAAKSYNKTRDKLYNTWSTSTLPKETIEAQLGGRYKVPGEESTGKTGNKVIDFNSLISNQPR